jgi:hypothetical protein
VLTIAGRFCELPGPLHCGTRGADGMGGDPAPLAGRVLAGRPLAGRTLAGRALVGRGGPLTPPGGPLIGVALGRAPLIGALAAGPERGGGLASEMDSRRGFGGGASRREPGPERADGGGASASSERPGLEATVARGTLAALRGVFSGSSALIRNREGIGRNECAPAGAPA